MPGSEYQVDNMLRENVDQAFQAFTPWLFDPKSTKGQSKPEKQRTTKHAGTLKANFCMFCPLCILVAQHIVYGDVNGGSRCMLQVPQQECKSSLNRCQTLNSWTMRLKHGGGAHPSGTHHPISARCEGSMQRSMAARAPPPRRQLANWLPRPAPCSPLLLASSGPAAQPPMHLPAAAHCIKHSAASSAAAARAIGRRPWLDCSSSSARWQA